MYPLILLQQIIASSTHLFAKNVTTLLHPSTVVLFRGFFSAIAYGLWLTLTRKQIKTLEKSDIPWFFVLGALNMPINQLLFIWGVKYTTPANASLAYALTPAFVLLIAVFFLGETLTRKKIFGIVLAMVGTIIVLFEKGLAFGSEQFTGNIMVLLASMSWAVYTTLGKKYAMKYGGVFMTGVTMITGLVLYIPVVMALPVSIEPWEYDGSIWFQLFYLGVITSGLGYALWYVALTRMEASKLAVFNNIQPVLTTIMAFFLFNTVPSETFILGAIVAICGVIITQKG
ncbi:MAG: DMT family transporter [Candidatus Kapaibacteriota bacterium]